MRAIGVSNFMRAHLDGLLKETSVVPAVNQIEVLPGSAAGLWDEQLDRGRTRVEIDRATVGGSHL